MKFQIALWNGQYYCRGRFPDGVGFELKSNTDLTYTQWEAMYQTALDEHDNPSPVDYPELYDGPFYRILNAKPILILEWKAEGQRLNIAQTDCTPLRDAAVRMRDIFIVGIP